MSGAPFQMEPKDSAFTRLLTLGPVMLFIDARHRGVRVAEKHKHRADLRIRFGSAASVRATETGLAAEASFDDAAPQPIFLPWPAVYGLWSDIEAELLVWQTSVPEEIEVGAQGLVLGSPPLRVVHGEGQNPSGGAPPALRVVK